MTAIPKQPNYSSVGWSPTDGLRTERGHLYTSFAYLTSGAHGDIWTALDEQGQKVAIKILLVEEYHSEAGEEELESIQTELDILEKLRDLRYTFAPTFIDWTCQHTIDTPPIFFLVMEYLTDYVSLQDARISDRPWLIRSLGAALSELHAHSISHGDLSLTNVMVSPRTGEVKLIDFGLGSLGERGSLGGSSDYRALERRLEYRPIGGQSLFPAGDLWAFGQLICTLYTGSPRRITYSYFEEIMRIPLPTHLEYPVRYRRLQAEGTEQHLLTQDTKLLKSQREIPYDLTSLLAFDYRKRALRAVNPLTID